MKREREKKWYELYSSEKIYIYDILNDMICIDII
jgi:hypothetical protein